MNQNIQNNQKQSTQSKKILSKLPTEILTMIFSHINDTDTYKNTRLGCRLFRDILIDVKIFDAGNLYLEFRLNKYYNNNDLEDITIMDKNKTKIGYIKTEFPACARYYLKLDNKTTEYTINPNDVVTKDTTNINNTKRTEIVVQNLHI